MCQPILLCENEGCSRSLSVAAYDAHQKLCAHRLIRCPHCAKPFKAREFATHVVREHQSPIVTQGDCVTFCVTNFCLDTCVVVLPRHEHGERYDATDVGSGAVMHVDTTGIAGQSGVFPIKQALVRACCMVEGALRRGNGDSEARNASESDGFSSWTVCVQNRLMNDTAEVRETTTAPLPLTPMIKACFPVAHASVLAYEKRDREEEDANNEIDVSLMGSVSQHVSDEDDPEQSGIVRWWSGSAMAAIRHRVAPVHDTEGRKRILSQNSARRELGRVMMLRHTAEMPVVLLTLKFDRG